MSLFKITLATTLRNSDSRLFCCVCYTLAWPFITSLTVGYIPKLRSCTNFRTEDIVISFTSIVQYYIGSLTPFIL